MRRRIVEVADTYDSAKKTRETFYGHKVRKFREHNFGWPRFVRYLGRTNAENYYSNKALGDGKWEFYKHIAEGPQFLFINDDITKLVNDSGETIEIRERRRTNRPNLKSRGLPTSFYASTYEITGEMPAHLADLASHKGTQWVDPSGRYFEARIPHSTLAAAKHPQTGETILVVYSDEGMHLLVTGPKLDVTADGITG